MKKVQIAVTALFAVAVSVSSVMADDHGDDVAVTPVELFACTYKKGKGMGDLNKVNAKFNKWADKHDPGYSGWTITPQFRSSTEPFHVGWIGSWDSGAEMGKGLDAWREDDDGVGAGFGQVLECNSHALMSSVEVMAPQGPPADSGVVWFSSCTRAEGVSNEEAFAAHKQFSVAMAELGGTGQSWLFYPALGAGDIKFDYYSVLSFASYADLGAGYDLYTRGGGYAKAAEAFAGVVSCDSPRVYSSTQVRQGSAGK